MSKGADDCVGGGKGQSFWDYANRINRIPIELTDLWIREHDYTGVIGDEPYTNKID